METREPRIGEDLVINIVQAVLILGGTVGFIIHGLLVIDFSVPIPKTLERISLIIAIGFLTTLGLMQSIHNLTGDRDREGFIERGIRVLLFGLGGFYLAAWVVSPGSYIMPNLTVSAMALTGVGLMISVRSFKEHPLSTLKRLYVYLYCAVGIVTTAYLVSSIVYWLQDTDAIILHTDPIPWMPAVFIITCGSAIVASLLFRSSIARQARNAESS